MTTLRVLVAARDAPATGVPWALYDNAGACTATGHDAPARWPQADALEIVIGAALVRLASVTLPPVAPARLATAAAFALEDRIAGATDEQWLVPSPRRVRGRVVVAIVGRAQLAAIRTWAGTEAPARVIRAVAEPELAAVESDARWCIPDAPELGSGFVRMPDGSAFPVDRCGPDAALPAELALALKAHDDDKPARVRVDAAVDDAALARWQRETGIAFVRGTPWRWHAAGRDAFTQASDLLQGEMAPISNAGRRRPSFAAALWLLAAAIAIHASATIGEWAWWRIDAWRVARAWTTLASAAGVDPGAASTPAAARAAIAERYAAARHAQGLTAPNDALPLLARAAPALAALPPGTLKSAVYADNHWTLDLQRNDAALTRELEVRLARAGTPAIVAPSATGVRLRIGAY